VVAVVAAVVGVVVHIVVGSVVDVIGMIVWSYWETQPGCVSISIFGRCHRPVSRKTCPILNLTEKPHWDRPTDRICARSNAPSASKSVAYPYNRLKESICNTVGSYLYGFNLYQK
jgi:hypothetical protein